MRQINVDLYGGKPIFGGKEKPLVARYIHCDDCDKCSLYAEGKCLNVYCPLTVGCPFGKMLCVKGYTSRAAKYYEFKNNIKQDPTYKKLDYPSDSSLVCIVGDTLIIRLKWVVIQPYGTDKKYDYNDKIINNKWVLSDPWKGYSISKKLIITKEECTPEILNEFFTFVPRSLMGDRIDKYQEEIVPSIVTELKRKVPEIYKSLIDKYPEYIKEDNWVGKTAYIYSLVDGSTLITDRGTFVKKGEYLTGTYKSSFLPFGANVADLKIKITEKMTYKIDDNSQVNENTVFA